MSHEHQNDEGCNWQVTVPATSANLGCAFDCGGLALKLYLKATYIPSQSSDGLSIQYRGATPDRIPLDDSNLVLSSFRYACAHLSKAVPDGHFQVEGEFPLGVGLGRSVASVISVRLL